MMQNKSGHTTRNSKMRRRSPQRFSGTASSRVPSSTEFTAPVVRQTGRKDAGQCHPHFRIVAPVCGTPEPHMSSLAKEDFLPSSKSETAAPTHGTFKAPYERACPLVPTPLPDQPKRLVSGPDSVGGGTACFNCGDWTHEAPREMSLLASSSSPRHEETHRGNGGDRQTHAENPKSFPNIQQQIARSAPIPSCTNGNHGAEIGQWRVREIRSKGRSNSDHSHRGRLARVESNPSTCGSPALSPPADTADFTRHGNNGGFSSKCVSRRCSPGTPTGASGNRVIHFEGMNTLLLKEAFTFADKMAEREKLDKLDKQREQQSTPGLTNNDLGRDDSTALSPRHDSRRSLPRLRSYSNRPWCTNTVRATRGGCTRGEESSAARKLASQAPKKGPSAFSIRTAAGVSASSAPKPSNTSMRNQNRVKSHHHSKLETEESCIRSFDNDPRGGRQGRTTPCQNEKRDEISSKGTTERQHTTDDNRAETTASLLQHFESGAGIAALKIELQESQASLKKATEAIGEAASRWRSLRQLN